MADDDTKSVKSGKSRKEDGDKKDDDEDERLEFILAYLTKSYRLKQEKWNKMISVDEYMVAYLLHR